MNAAPAAWSQTPPRGRVVGVQGVPPHRTARGGRNGAVGHPDELNAVIVQLTLKYSSTLCAATF